MPTYEYVCKKCGYEFEEFQNMKDDVLTDCPKCKKKALKRKIGIGAGIIFKGTGFYCTDYKHSNASPSPNMDHESSDKKKETTSAAS